MKSFTSSADRSSTRGNPGMRASLSCVELMPCVRPRRGSGPADMAGSMTQELAGEIERTGEGDWLLAPETRELRRDEILVGHRPRQHAEVLRKLSRQPNRLLGDGGVIELRVAGD